MRYQNLIEAVHPDYRAIIMSYNKKNRYSPNEINRDKQVYDKYTELAASIRAELIQDCQPWFKLSEGSRGFRGMRNRGAQHNNKATEQDIHKIKFVRTDRTAADNPQEMTNAIDDSLDKLGYNFVHRENALFVVGDSGEASGFGTVYRIFPIGDFQFVWNPQMQDPWGEYDNSTFHNWDNKTRTSAEENLMSDLQFKYKSYAKEMGTNILNFEEWTKDFLNNNSFEEEIEYELGQGQYDKTFDLDLFWDEAGQYYTNEDLESALQSGNEIMIRVGSYHAIHNEFVEAFMGGI